MEKFGIFELLDALSAITSGENGASSFTKPAESSASVSATTEPERPHIPAGEAAFTSFLERHNRIAEDIDRKKK